MRSISTPASRRFAPFASALLLGCVMPPFALEAARIAQDFLPRTAVLAIAPLVIALPFHAVWLREVRSGRLRTAVALGLTWAAAVSLVSIPVFAYAGERYEAIVLQATAYRGEMFTWIRTGVGQEGDPSIFVAEHARHFSAFAALSFFSAGALGLALGAALLDYMNFYVAALLHRGDALFPLAILAWPLYAVVRVVGFVAAASGLAALALSFQHRGGGPRRRAARYIAFGVGLVLADLALKAWLAPHYREWFRALTDLR